MKTQAEKSNTQNLRSRVQVHPGLFSTHEACSSGEGNISASFINARTSMGTVATFESSDTLIGRDQTRLGGRGSTRPSGCCKPGLSSEGCLWYLIPQQVARVCVSFPHVSLPRPWQLAPPFPPLTPPIPKLVSAQTLYEDVGAVSGLPGRGICPRPGQEEGTLVCP